MPDGAAGLRSQHKGIVRGGYKHKAIENYRGDFQAIGIGRMENPLRAQLADIPGMDLIETAETTTGIIAIVRQPIGADGLRGKSFPRHFYGSGNREAGCPLGVRRNSQKTEKRSFT